MSITLFSVTLAGAIGAINAIDNLTTGYVAEGEQREANHTDFSNAYDRISQNLDPLPPLAEQAQFGLAFVEVPGRPMIARSPQLAARQARTSPLP